MYPYPKELVACILPYLDTQPPRYHWIAICSQIELAFSLICSLLVNWSNTKGQTYLHISRPQDFLTNLCASSSWIVLPITTCQVSQERRSCLLNAKEWEEFWLLISEGRLPHKSWTRLGTRSSYSCQNLRATFGCSMRRPSWRSTEICLLTLCLAETISFLF